MTPSTTRPDHDRTALERRLEAVERALSDEEPLERIDRLDDLEERVVELEAAVQALRGYVGSVRAVNEDVERRADRAFRKAAAVERHLAPETATGAPRHDGGDDDGRDGRDGAGRDGRHERATGGRPEPAGGGHARAGDPPPQRPGDDPDGGSDASQGALSRLRRRL